MKKGKVYRFKRGGYGGNLLPDDLKLVSHKDILPGGLADKAIPKDFNQKQLIKGVKIELEHTDDKNLAREIAMDHLTEDPKYYDKLEKD
jgi:hypothetical protein